MTRLINLRPHDGPVSLDSEAGCLKFRDLRGRVVSILLETEIEVEARMPMLRARRREGERKTA